MALFKKKTISPQSEGFVYRNSDISLLRMGILSVALGVIVGVGTIVFRYVIALIFNVSFYGKLSLQYSPDIKTDASIWGVYIIFVPVIGAIILVWLIKTFVKNSESHGVPEVISRLYHARERKNTTRGVVMGFSAALSIGTGGSTGNESPYIQVGTSFAEGMSQHINLSKKQRNILISAGAAAGLATCLNAPLTGIIFAIELVLVTINITSLFPVAVCTLTAVYIYRFIFGAGPAFLLSGFDGYKYELIHMQMIVIFLAFGIATGVLSVISIKIFKYIERFFSRIESKYTRHCAGMLIVGIILYLMLTYTGSYYVDGIGEYAVFDVLIRNILNPWFLLLLVFLKIVATAITVGSGSSGGVFTPIIFIGAIFGGFCYLLLNIYFPELKVDPHVFVMAGIAGMVASTIGVFLTGIIVVFEMFGNIHYVYPVIITASIAFAVRKLMKTDSVYAMSLKEKGLIVPEGLQAAIIPAINAHNIMSNSFCIMSLEKAYQQSKIKERIISKNFVVITEKGRILGIMRNPIVSEETIELFREHICSKVMLFHTGTSLLEITKNMQDNSLDYAIISRRIRIDKPYSVKGLITRSEIDVITMKEYNWLN
ncbi:MAG TPA: hypothetical protein DD381_13680 [Lentisphaeria bacterium]|nr:MAG: hypothetical protein A2X47_03795 [Lentisphaerae bacterium GWF2_38_69]HBM17372.1 hypothetical protein [Lentisphaeria bacterium]